MSRHHPQDTDKKNHTYQKQMGLSHDLICQGQNVLRGCGNHNDSAHSFCVRRVIHGNGLGKILHILVIMAAVLTLETLDDLF